MTIASLGIVGGLAAAPAAQRSAETEKAQHETADQARADKAAERAEQAAGIGQTAEDAEAQERDADGRRLWEQAPHAAALEEHMDSGDPAPQHRVKDPTGERGGQLDVVG